MGQIIRHSFKPKSWVIMVSDMYADDVVRGGKNGDLVNIATNDIDRVAELIEYAKNNYQKIPKMKR